MLTSVLVLSVQTGVCFHLSSELKTETAFYQKDRVISNTKGYVLIKILVFWYDLVLLVVYIDVHYGTSAVPIFLTQHLHWINNQIPGKKKLK